MQCSLLSVLGILSFLSLLAFSQSKQSKDGKLRLQPKLKPLQRVNQDLEKPELNPEYLGLPGEPEYEIDTSDQEKVKPSRGSSERLDKVLRGEKRGLNQQETEFQPSFISRLLSSVINFKMAEDLADRLDDLICAWDKVMGTDFETLILLLLGWIGFGGVIFLISHIIYSSLSTGESGVVSPGVPSSSVGGVSTPLIPPFKDIAQKTSLPKIAVNNNISSLDAAQPILSGPKTEPGGTPIHSNGIVPASDVPTAVGSDPDVVQYVNKCWEYIYNHENISNEITRLWFEKMNEFTKRSALEDGLYVEFLGLDLTREGGSRLGFNNMTAEPLPGDNMSVTSDLNAEFSFKLKTTRPLRDRIEAADYILLVDRIRARFSLTVINGERLIIAKLDGWPDLKLRVQSQAGISANLSREEQNLLELIEEISTSALRGVQLDIRMDELAGFPMFKRSIQPKPISSNGKVSRGGSRPAAFPRSNGQHAPDGPARVLDVKVVKAVQLGGQAGNCLEPYVVVEVDDPSQRQQTRPGSGPQTQWNETFSMDITSCSSEVLFEVWDQGQKIGKSDTFLGLGIVSVSELMCTISQRHVIPLQGRPYEEDQVTGMLTIEFLFKDGGISFSDTDTMHGVHKTLEMRQSKGVGGGVQYNTKTTYSLYDPPDGGLDSVDWAEQAAIQERSAPVDGISLFPEIRENITILRRESYIRANKQDLLNGADVADLAIQELAARSRDKSLEDQPIKSTLLIHAVQKPPRTQSSSVQSPNLDSTENVCSDSLGDVSLTSRESGGPLRRGREKKRNLISTIKKRFSGTRSLSTSMKFEDNSRTSSSSRVPSLDRIRSASEHRSENFSNTSSYLTIPGLHSEDASSMSDVSGISAASNKTYVTEDSSLVLETLEDGRHHHYLIPAQVAKRGRFKKRGIKLHIYLDHIFVARHIKLGTVCSACNEPIPMRLGKQAYVCRDCGATTHKPCHAKMDTHCQHTSLPSMELYRGSTIMKMGKFRGAGLKRTKSSNHLSPRGWKSNKNALQQRNSLEGQEQPTRQLKNKQPNLTIHRGHTLDQSTTSLRVQLEPQGSQEEGRSSMIRRISSLRRISRSSSWKLSKNLFGTKLR